MKMNPKRSLDEEIDIDAILNILSSDFEAIRNELQKQLKEEITHKHLKRMGKKQFFDATSECSNEMESQNTRKGFAKINKLSVELHDTIDVMIARKFQGDFHNTLKQKVLRAVMTLYSKQETCASEELPNNDADFLLTGNSGVLDKLKDMSKYCAKSIIDIKKQAIQMSFEEARPSSSENCKEMPSSRIKEESSNNDNENLDVGNTSLGSSLSSVRTSELSSFDDDIIFSSDEETQNEEKRMFLKEAQEKMAEIKTENMENSKDRIYQAETIKSEDESLSSPKETSSVPSSPRVCKSNSKPVSENSILLSRKISAPSPVSTMNSMVPVTRKRGRPRKHTIQS